MSLPLLQARRPELLNIGGSDLRAIAALAILLAGCQGDRSVMVDEPSFEEQRAASTLGLTAPCRLEWFSMYKDGGSIGGLIRDSQGQLLDFAWDGRMHRNLPRRRVPLAWPTPERFNAPDTLPRLAYMGADYPTKVGANAIPVNSPAESALVDVLQAIATREFPPSVQDCWVRIYFDYSANSLRHELANELSPDEKHALGALRLVWVLKQQRAGVKRVTWKGVEHQSW